MSDTTIKLKEINIKEAYRYHNYLDDIMQSLFSHLRANNAIVITEKHNKSKADPDAEDSVVTIKPEKHFGDNYNVVDIASLINEIIAEKLHLSNSIVTAKENLKFRSGKYTFTIDSAIEYAKKTRSLTTYIRSLLNLKSKEENESGRGLKFNAEGNQISYIYDIEKITTIDFDRKVLGTLHKKLLGQADELSTLVEENMLKKVVVFSPRYSVHKSVDEIVEDYLANKDK